jgi:hypothetical protein
MFNGYDTLHVCDDKPRFQSPEIAHQFFFEFGKQLHNFTQYSYDALMGLMFKFLNFLMDEKKIPLFNLWISIENPVLLLGKSLGKSTIIPAGDSMGK